MLSGMEEAQLQAATGARLSFAAGVKALTAPALALAG
jgi:hypothetical protein